MPRHLVSLLLLATAGLAACPVIAATFTVASSADAGPGSLRQAILDANADAGADDIVFAIPGAGPHVIAVQTPLPAVTGTVRIDGYSQPGASANTLADGWDAQLRIEIDGIAVATGVGLHLQGGPGSEVRGLAIVNVRGTSIQVEVDDAVVAGNLVGLRADGRTPNTVGLVGNNGAINVWREQFAPSARRIRIGGPAPADRNLVAGVYNAISINARPFTDPTYTGTEDALIENNWLGLDRTGTGVVSVHNGIRVSFSLRATIRDNTIVSPYGAPVGPFAGGGYALWVYFRATDTVIERNRIGVDPLGDGLVAGFVPFGAIGGIALGDVQVTGGRIGRPGDPAYGNIVAHTGTAAIRIMQGARRIAIAGNSAPDTGRDGQRMAIDLEGPTGPNSNDPLDADTGSNEVQNHPLLSAATVAGGATTIAGTLHSLPQQTFTVEFHAASECPANGRSRAQRTLGQTQVGTDASGDAAIAAVVAAAPAGWAVAATATDPDGNTSELGPCIAVAGPAAPGTFVLSDIRYRPAEFRPSVNAVVRRIGGSAGAVAVSLVSQDGTAQAGIDYQAIDSELTWADGDSSERAVAIQVIGDQVHDPDEYFVLRLLAPTGGAQLGEIGGAVVVVTDVPERIFASDFEPLPLP